MASCIRKVEFIIGQAVPCFVALGTTLVLSKEIDETICTDRLFFHYSLLLIF